MNSKTRIIKFTLIALTVLIADQSIKQAVINSFDLYETREVIKGLFNLVYITNTGAAFGFMAGAEKWRHLMFQAIGFTALGGLFYLYINSESESRFLLWGSALVFGGTAGNLMDRIRFHKVVDFLDFYIGNHHWPAFNIADSAITVGALLLAIFFLNSDRISGM